MRSRARCVTERLETYTRARVLAYEMEASAILVMSALRGIAGGCILSIDGWVAHVQAGNFLPDVAGRDRGIAQMIDVALDAVAMLHRERLRCVSRLSDRPSSRPRAAWRTAVSSSTPRAT